MSGISGQLGRDLAAKDPNFESKSTPESERRRTEHVERFYAGLFGHPAVEAITWWDFSDQRARQRAPAGLVQAHMNPKPAYNTLKQVIKDKWWTRSEIVAGSNREASFRGSFGEYRVSFRQGNQELTGGFSFDKTTLGRCNLG